MMQYTHRNRIKHTIISRDFSLNFGPITDRDSRHDFHM